MPSPEAAIAIDLGGTKCAAALIDREGTLAFHKTVKYGNASGDAVGDVMISLAEDLISLAASNRITLSGVGVSVPGIARRQAGTVWAPNIKGWEEYPLSRVIKEKLSRRDLPVMLESDRGCCILGECWQGAAQGARNAIFLAVGTGIGAGILVDGHLVRGSHDIAGAVGWVALQRPYHDKLKHYGHFEYYASGDGLVRAAEELVTTQASELIHAGNIHQVTAESLFDAYEKKDPVACQVFDQAISLWGMAGANLVSLFNPEKIIFGGGVFGPGVQFLDQIYREAEKWAQPIAIRQVRFVTSRLEGKAQLYGAAYQAFKNNQLIQ